MKNLTLNMNITSLPRPATSSGIEGSSHSFSASTSPQKDTPRTGRRKPTNLTIRTPGFQQLTFTRPTGDVPPTPSSRPSLHHIQSSPALPSFLSPTTASSGLYLPPPSVGSAHSRPGSDSSTSSQSNNGGLPELKEEDESDHHHQPKSQETQERGYPHGPVLIYDSGLYLYLEPTLEEASNFDTVINVAKEIKNPFSADTAPLLPPPPPAWKDRVDRVEGVLSEPQTAISEMSFKSAWEWPRAAEATTPTTPRPISSSRKKEPEYLHIQWDHNSEILEDLYPLCQLIDDRIKAGKKVLVHCQLGVSRSASLVIAYGLYKGYQPDFHSMYMTVKSRSEWVGPNLSLIYQLTDFRSKVVQGEYEKNAKFPSPSWFKNATLSSPDVDTPVAQRPTEVSAAVSASALAPTPPAKRISPPNLNKALPPVPLVWPVDLAPGAPASDTVADRTKITTQAPAPNTALVVLEPSQERPSTKHTAAPRPLPFRERFEFETPAQIPPHRALNLNTSGSAFNHQVSSNMDLAMQDVPETPSLFSPRATQFIVSPFRIPFARDRTIRRARSATALAMPRDDLALRQPPFRDPISATAADPRSPHQQGEAGDVFRHIDDFLS